MANKWVLFFILTLSLSTFGRENRLVFNQNFSNTASGVSFKTPKGWSGQPLIAINIWDGKSKSDEIWNRKQHLAKFMGPEGKDSLLFAEVKSLKPNLNNKYITPTDFDKLATKESYNVSITDTQKLKQWLISFLNNPSDNTSDFTHKIITLPSARVKAHLFRNHNQSAYIFRAKDRKIYALILTKTTEFSQKSWQKYINNLGKSITLSQPKATSIVNQKGETGASRTRVIQALKALPNWQYWETEHYIICSDLKSKDRKLISLIKSNIEKYHFAYSQVIKPWKPITEVSVVKVFANREDYLNYVGEDLKWSGGVWMPSKQELVVSPPGWDADKKQKTDSVLKVLYHEAFHQYLHYACQGTENSTWYNEGHAQLFEGAVIKGSRLTVMENDYKASQLKKTIEASNGTIKNVIHLTPSQFYSENQRDAAYSVSWALVYYLRKYAMHKKNKFKDILPKYREELKRTKDCKKATEFAFKYVDIDELQKEFIDFWQSSSDRKRALRANIFKGIKIKK